MITKNESDFGDGYYKEGMVQSDDSSSKEEENDDESVKGQEKQPVKKLVSLVLDICKPLFGSGAIVNMDNYYTSPEVAIALQQQDVFMQGTCRTNRLGSPVAV